MFDEVDEIAFAMWTADTGDASRQGWLSATSDHDKYMRMAKAAIAVIEKERAPDD